MSNRASHGFTLVELVVAIALVAILTILLFSGINSARSSADASRCVTHLRTIAAAALLYTSENGGLLPDRTRWQDERFASDPSQSIWYYLNLPDERAIPDAKKRGKQTVVTCPASHRLHPAQPSSSRRTYGLNTYSSGGDRNSSSWEAHLQANGRRFLSAVPTPSKQAFFMDGSVRPLAGGWYYAANGDPKYHILGTEEGFVYPHGEKMNVVYLDGHVKAIEKARMKMELTVRTDPFWGAKH